MQTNKEIRLSRLNNRYRSSTQPAPKFNMPTPKPVGFFARLNHKLNSLSNIQYSMVLIGVVLAVVIFGRMILTFAAPTIVKYTGETGENILGMVGIENNCKSKDELDPECWSDSFFPQMEQTDGYTNALLIGLDTRDDNPGLLNSDTIILASYNHKDGKTVLISFPRDLYVTYSVKGRPTGYFTRINTLYAMGEQRKEYNDGIEMLEENMEEWFDMEIHYTAKINLKAVPEVINAVGEIEIELEKDYTDIYPYSELSPEYQRNCKRSSSHPDYCVYTFKKGVNKLKGEDALIYARMRQFSSDFDRAHRQQEVIEATKDKFLSGDTSVAEKAKFIWDIFETVTSKGNVETNVEYKDIMGGLYALPKADKTPIKIVLDPEFGKGNFMTPDMAGEASVVRIFDPSFGAIRQEVEKIRKSPDLYANQASVLILDATDTGDENAKIIQKIKTDKLYFQYFATQKATTKDNVAPSMAKIYLFSESKRPTAEYLKKNYFEDAEIIYIGTKDKQKESNESPTPTTTDTEDEIKPTNSHKEDIRVEVG